MRFPAPSTPKLTPLGHRLLTLSENKLANLEPPLGGREPGSALWRGVVVREAVRSAWQSVEEGCAGDLTDWKARGAMGLDVIGEDEEEDDEYAYGGARGDGAGWFEDVLSTLGDDDINYVPFSATVSDSHEWTVSSVSGVDEIQYDEEGMEAYTFPVPRSPSPSRETITLPTTLAIGHASRVNIEHASVSTSVTVKVVDVDAYVNLVLPDLTDSSSSSGSVWLPSTPLPTPTLMSSSTSPYSDCSYDSYDDDLDDDEFSLPPALVRSLSLSSSSLDDIEECTTPTGQCEELEVVAADSLDLDVRTIDESLDGIRYERKSGGLGLNIGMRLEDVSAL